MLNKERVISLVHAYATIWNIPVHRLVVGGDSALVLHEIIPEAETILIELDDEEWDKYLSVTNNNAYNEPVEGLLGTTFQIGDCITLAKRGWNGDNTVLVGDNRVRTYQSLMNTYEQLAAHPMRSQDAAMRDVSKIKLIDAKACDDANTMSVTGIPDIHEAFGYIALAVRNCMASAVKHIAKNTSGTVFRFFDDRDRVWYAEVIEGKRVRFSRTKLAPVKRTEVMDTLTVLIGYKHHQSDFSFTIEME